MSQHLLFDAAGMKLAVPAGLVTAIHEDLPVQAIDGTCDWFLGLAVVSGKLLPVTDLGAFCGKGQCTGRTLELDSELAIAGLRIDEVSGLSDNPPVASEIDAQEPVDELHPLNLTGESVNANDEHTHAEHLVLNLEAFVQSAAFINIEEH